MGASQLNAEAGSHAERPALAPLGSGRSLAVSWFVVPECYEKLGESYGRSVYGPPPAKTD